MYVQIEEGLILFGSPTILSTIILRMLLRVLRSLYIYYGIK